MGKPPYYPLLAEAAAARGIGKTQIADALGVHYKTFYNKWNGLTPFTWPEVVLIRDTFFPGMELEPLFTTCG